MDVDVIFERSGKDPFIMNVDYFDTVPKIKEKIHKLQGIPISQQTLIFQGKTLRDDFNILVSDITDKSRIQLVVASKNDDLAPPATPDTADHPAKMAENDKLLPPADPAAANHPEKMAKNDELTPKQLDFDMEFELVNAMIEELRYPVMMIEKEFPPLEIIYAAAKHPEKIAEIVLPPPKDFKFVTMKDLHSVKTTTGNDLPPPETPPAAAAPNHAAKTNGNHKPADEKSNDKPPPDSNSRMKRARPLLRVVVDFRGERTPVEVNRDDRVATLRKKLVEMGVKVPEGSYFFVHAQDTMEEDQTYRWHRVAQGDEIAVFPGFVTCGS